jgi:hypothetical protein
MPYAVVRDVAASWEQYPLLAEAIADPLPAELILHLAGPTDEGFRTIEVWETREGWQRWCDERPADTLSRSLAAPPMLRELEALATLGALAELRR